MATDEKKQGAPQECPGQQQEREGACMEWADRINEAYYDGMGADFGRLTRERIHWMCAQAVGTRVLDVGCSQGITSLLLAREGFQVLGIDVSAQAIAYACTEREREPASVRDRLQFRHCDLASLSDLSFDTILLGEVVEHQIHPQKFIENAVRLLADGGRLVITVPFGLHPFPDHKSTIFPAVLAGALPENFAIVSMDVVDDYLRLVASRSADGALGQDRADCVLRATEMGALSAQTRFYENQAALGDLKNVNARLQSTVEKASAEREDLSRLVREQADMDRRNLQRIADLLDEVANERGRASDALREMDVLQFDRERSESELRDRIKAIEDAFVIAQQKRDGHYAHLRAERARTAQIIGIAQSLHEENQRYGQSVALAIGRAVLGLTSPSGIIGFPKALAEAIAMFLLRRRQGMVFAPLALPPVADVSSWGSGKAGSPEAKRLSIIGWQHVQRADKLTIMSVMDEFTRTCFSPHANLLEPRPDNWEGLLEEYRPEMLFVESTWKGNHGAWQFRVANYAHPPGKELAEMVEGCRRMGIPTVFWNKEDPVHFDNFIDAASHFDYVLTTAEEAVPAYRERSRAKVGTLQFAAEESIHNPIGSAQRNERVCFAGSFYASRFADRQADQLMLLEAASTFDLDIYDRNFVANSKATRSSEFSFPEHLARFVRGSLPYDAMSKAYREYRVFLNVNSVIDSPTMFSRRVFELLACGTPVVSTWSRGTEETFGNDLVWHVRSRGEAEEAIKVLLGDEREWRRRSLQGIRKVMSQHTSADRFRQILEFAGLQGNSSSSDHVLAVASAATHEQARTVIASFARQQMPSIGKARLLLIKEGDFEVPDLGVDVDVAQIGQHSLSEIALDAARTQGMDKLAFLHPGAVYGRHHLQDLLLALRYSAAAVVGKPMSGATGDQYRFDVALDARSLVVSLRALQEAGGRLEDVIAQGDGGVSGQGTSFYVADNANFARMDNGSEAERNSKLHAIEV